MRTFNRPFYWPDGNGSFDTYYWQCGCDGSGGGNGTIPASNANDLSFEASNGDVYDNLVFEANDGTIYDDIEVS